MMIVLCTDSHCRCPIHYKRGLLGDYSIGSIIFVLGDTKLLTETLLNKDYSLKFVNCWIGSNTMRPMMFPKPWIFWTCHYNSLEEKCKQTFLSKMYLIWISNLICVV